MGKTIRMTCRACGYTTAVDIGSAMNDDPHNCEDDEQQYDMDAANICPCCGGLSLWNDGVESYWD